MYVKQVWLTSTACMMIYGTINYGLKQQRLYKMLLAKMRLATSWTLT